MRRRRVKVGRFVAIVAIGLSALLGACSSNRGAEADTGGAPVPAGGACGGSGGGVCEASLWCDPEPGHCGDDDAPGVCVFVPQMCTHDYRPVCGCDGRTHGNDCSRQSARAAKDHDGECASRSGSD